MLFELSTGYWIAVWTVMGLAVLVIWLAIVLGSTMLDGSTDEGS